MAEKQICVAAKTSWLTYYGFIILGVGMVLLARDYALGASMLALAVIFFPDDNQTTWSQKTWWSKSIIISVHLILPVGLVIIALMKVVQ